MPSPLILPLPLDQAIKAAAASLVRDQRGAATITATTHGLEGAVSWRIAPWWQLTGIVQKPWGTPFEAAIQSSFHW